MDARHLQRRARVDAGDIGMGVRRAHDSRMKLIGEFEVVEKAAVPPQQARVLAPQYRLSDGKFAHDLFRTRRSRGAWRRRMKQYLKTSPYMLGIEPQKVLIDHG